VLDRVRVVLVRPRRGGNVGSVARAMKNMGLEDLVLVAPRTRCGRTAERMAVHAADVLARRRTVATLADAVADCRLVVGTVGRPTTPPDEPATPREVATQVVAAGRRGRVAIVFGPEDHGLSNAELGLCQRAVRIPTSPGYPSLNLAQAVAVCAYEILLASTAEDPAAAGAVAGAGAPPATASEREEMLAHLARALGAIGFLPAQNPEHILRDVRSLFARAGTTARDVRVWRGVARQVLWAAARAGLGAACEVADVGPPSPPPARARPRSRGGVSPADAGAKAVARSGPGSRAPRPARPRSR
jgi:TrmH family RNA methyltransferase